MRGFLATVAAATAIMAGASIMGASVDAAPVVAPGAIRAAADSLEMVEPAQFIWLDHSYCWYDDGWNGPGWYLCGYGPRTGLGWGGGFGWHNWRGGHAGGIHGHPTGVGGRAPGGGGHLPGGAGGGHPPGGGGGHPTGGGGRRGGHPTGGGGHKSDIHLNEDIVLLARDGLIGKVAPSRI